MKHIKLRLTVFQVHKLKNIVGLGTTSSYQISTFYGDKLGYTSTIVNPSEREAANNDFWLVEPASSSIWLQKFKSCLGL